MILKSLIDSIDEIKKISAAAGLPIEVEQDKTSSGIDSKIILGDMPVEKHDNFYDLNFEIMLEYKCSVEFWQSLLKKIQVLSQNFAADSTFLFGGWSKIDDNTNIIYQCKIILKNMISEY